MSNRIDVLTFLAASRAEYLWTALSDETAFREIGGRTIRDWEYLLNRCQHFNRIAMGDK